MIVGIGSDIVDIRRIEKILRCHGERFEKRYFTVVEQAKADTRRLSPTYYSTYAKRFAAKEACAKALGSGFVDDIIMKDIGVEQDDSGRPYLVLSGGALKKLNLIIPENRSPSLHLSLSDEPPYAQAFVVIEAVSS